jgi:hypothetical protein
MSLYRVYKKIEKPKPKPRKRRSVSVTTPQYEPVDALPIEINYFFPQSSYTPTPQYEYGNAYLPEKKSNAWAWGIGGIIGVLLFVGVAAGIERYSRENRVNIQIGTIPAQVLQVKVNPAEAYMKYWSFPEPVVEILKPVGDDLQWTVNDKALMDEVYFLPSKLKTDERVLSNLRSIAWDRIVTDQELSNFRATKNALIQELYQQTSKPSQLSQPTQSCPVGYDLIGSTCIKRQANYQIQPSYQQYPSQNCCPQQSSPSYSQYSYPSQPSYPSQSPSGGPSPRPDTGGSGSSGGPLPPDRIP